MGVFVSYSSLLMHRCNFYEIQEIAVDGSPIFDWQIVSNLQNVRCFLDLGFIRKGKDPYWSESAGRPADRTGVLFLPSSLAVKSGYRVDIIKGPKGMFSIEGALDEAWTPGRKHHQEVGVVEVATSLRPQANKHNSGN